MKKQVSPVVTVIVILVVVVIVALIWSYLGQGGKTMGPVRLEGGPPPIVGEASPAERAKALEELKGMSKAADERFKAQQAAEKAKSPAPAESPADEKGGE